MTRVVIEVSLSQQSSSWSCVALEIVRPCVATGLGEVKVRRLSALDA